MVTVKLIHVVREKIELDLQTQVSFQAQETVDGGVWDQVWDQVKDQIEMEIFRTLFLVRVLGNKK
jgi:hypothetical protein